MIMLHYKLYKGGFMKAKVKFNFKTIIVLIVIVFFLIFFACNVTKNPLRIGYWDQCEWDNCAWGE